MSLPEWKCSDELANANVYCATFARAKIAQFFERRFIPQPDDPTGTVTFISFEGRTYAVTAFHVVDQFQAAAAREGAKFESFHVPAGRGIGIQPPFVRPVKSLVGHDIDVVLRPIDPGLPPHIGKKAFELKSDAEPEFPLRYAIACGFPTAQKMQHLADDGERVALPYVEAVAEGISRSDGDQLQFYSELEHRPPIASLSGMSGGPVFWSDGDRHGLVGFVKEAMDVHPRDDGSSLHASPIAHFICQRASYSIFGAWAEYADKEFPKQREVLNAAVVAAEKSSP